MSKDARSALIALDLDPEAAALDAVTIVNGIRLAPEGVDPRGMPVSDIVFDPALLDEFPVLEGDGRAAAARFVFDLYKTRGKNKDHNRRLHDEIGLFIERTHRSRKTGVPHVKEKIRATKKQRDLLALLAEKGIESIEDLERALTQEA